MIYSDSVSLDVMQGDGDQERLKRQQELTALNLYQLQQLQYQYLLRYASPESETFMKRHYLRQFIRFHTSPSGATKGFIKHFPICSSTLQDL